MKIAMTRAISANLGQCELSYRQRQAIDLELARAQHKRYEECLSRLGFVIHRLAEEPDLPDSVFVEDAAVVLDELAVITHPGAPSRRAEIDSVAKALGQYRSLFAIRAPGTLDGGDVLRMGKRLFVGLSQRTNLPALEQLRMILAPLSYEVSGVPVENCLHLKSAVTALSHDTLLINRDWIDPGAFGPLRLIDVDPTEPAAANALWAGDAVIFSSEFPATRLRLESHGFGVVTLDVSELAKAEGALTCCSLLFAV